MNEEAEKWINRYIDAYGIVTRQVSSRIKERIPDGLTNDQFSILRLIRGQEHCTSTYLSEAVAVGKSSITAIINRLVDAGMLERTRDEQDRRLVYLTLTPHGEEVYRIAEIEVQQIIAPYLLHFKEDEIEMFVTQFEKLASLMQESGGRNP
ncbi:MarR family winged helix-turn-helix transcriptional regulator [Paenibacillus tengchongensis]|uniref:MarR family winged helix-turn-helix transcriptional regulator n=1 Tax=Paenibacillus tengchongensis TaxID=2608684 RepID=UPI00124CA38A|nr:MarR family transcriptional regulator [Paenibacillus tengchongensis]